jgi:sortase A
MSSAVPQVEPAPLTSAGVRPSRRPGWVLRLLGKIFLTAAFILAAYIAWLLWGTGFYTSQQQEGLRQGLESQIAAVAQDPNDRPRVVPPGGAYAILEIPSIEVDMVVVQGTDVMDLKKGPGHYQTSADPWEEEGRVAIAGHRTTYGAPFWDLDKIRPRDQIVLATERGTFQYVVTNSREVLPGATEVLRSTDQPSLILTTCSPKFSAARRLIVEADRVDESA